MDLSFSARHFLSCHSFSVFFPFFMLSFSLFSSSSFSLFASTSHGMRVWPRCCQFCKKKNCQRFFSTARFLFYSEISIFHYASVFMVVVLSAHIRTKAKANLSLTFQCLLSVCLINARVNKERPGNGGTMHNKSEHAKKKNDTQTQHI